MLFFPADRTAIDAPAELLALDEALLDHGESRVDSGFLTFWESMTYFVVLGYGKHLTEEVFEDQCAKLDIPILRRCSGGGTVLQGPGCLNYSLVLPIASAPELGSISGANCYIMQRIHTAVSPLLREKVSVQGHTDLTLDGLKFSGNAQRRKRHCLLFHGSFLLNFDLAVISRTLRNPGQQPEYRAKRSHAEFLANIHLDRAAIEQALIDEWKPAGEADSGVIKEILSSARELAGTKYARDDWNRRW